MINKLRPYIFITFVMITVLFLHCREKTPEEHFIERIEKLSKLPSSKPFDSIEELENTVLSKFKTGSAEELAVLLVNYELFKEFYPYTEEGKSSNSLSAEEFFNALIKTRRMNSLLSQYNSFKENNYKLLSIGEPKKSIELGPYKLHKFVPLILETRDKKGEIVKDFNDKLLGAILEKNGKFYWLNVFRG